MSVHEDRPDAEGKATLEDAGCAFTGGGGGDKRLHPVSPLFIALAYIKSFFIPILLALVAGGGRGFDWIALYLILPGIGIAVLQYWVYRYALDAREIVIREGLLFKTLRHIPYTRIQNLNLTRNPLHRLFGVAQVELESASGSRPEAVMRVVSLSGIEAMRAKLLAARGMEQTTPSEPEEQLEMLLALPPRELVLAGIISNKGMLVVGAVFAFWVQVYKDAAEEFQRRMADLLPGWLGDLDLAAGDPLLLSLSLVLTLLGFLLLVRLLSILFTLVTFYGFELRRTADKLTGRYGLLTQINSTLPRRRIQQITLTQTWLHRCFGRCAIRVCSAGGGEGDGGAKLRWLAPILPVAQARDFLRRVQPELDYEIQDWQPVAFRAWKRVAKRYGIPAALAAGLLLLLVPAWLGWWLGGLFVLLLVWILFYARRYVASLRYGISENCLVFESGFFTRHCTYVPLAKIQSLCVGQTPLDRGVGMASLLADVAGLERQRHYVDIPFLDEAVAQALLAQLNARVSITAYRW